MVGLQLQQHHVVVVVEQEQLEAMHLELLVVMVVWGFNHQLMELQHIMAAAVEEALTPLKEVVVLVVEQRQLLMEPQIQHQPILVEDLALFGKRLAVQAAAVVV
jgi:hypothetical protein